MKPQTTAAVLLALGVSFGVGLSPAAAQDLAAIDDGLFKSTDLNGNGKISRREIIHHTDLLFLSADTNDDDVLTVDEFLQWDPGYLSVAEKTGKTAELNSAKQEVFKLLDVNGDGNLEHEEFSSVALYDFYRADKNSDGVLSQDEFIGEFRIVKTVRSALE